jgi:xanthine dehydrogenase molybdopterin-binding subunit B/xanthine dehydrogenase iron-sulfur cluster and FAD-binding subunit A
VYRTANACLFPLCSLDGYSVTTAEGLGSSQAKDGFHPVQERIADFNGSQCGFCTPGMVMALYGQLQRSSLSSDAGSEVVQLSAKDAETCIDGHICRCTGYRPILDACKSFATDAAAQDQIGGHGATAAPQAASSPCQKGRLGPPFPEFLREHIQASGSGSVAEFSGSNWTLYRPATLAQAHSLLAEHPGARLEVSRTSNGIYKDHHTAAAGTIINLLSIPDLTQTRTDPGSGDMTFGSAVSISAFIAAIQQARPGCAFWGAVAAHALKIAGYHVRNVGSIGGNLVLAAGRGFYSDLATVLLGAGASVTVSAGAGTATTTETTQDLGEFLAAGGPGAGGLLLSVSLPCPRPGQVYKSYRVALRPMNAHPLVNAAFCVTVGDGGVVTEARIVFGAVNERHAVRARNAEAALVGNAVGPALAQAVRLACAAEVVVTGGDRVEYRQRLVDSLLYKFLVSLMPTEGPGAAGKDASAADKQQWAARPPATGQQDLSVLDEAGAAPRAQAPVHEPVPKVGARLQASGEAAFTDDYPMPHNTLFAAYITCNQAHMKVVSVDWEGVKKCPGVVDVVGPSDFRGANKCGGWWDEPVLAESTAFCGQQVGIVLADSQAHAFAAAAVGRAGLTLEPDAALGPVIVTNAQARAADSFYPGMTRNFKRGDFAAGLAQAEHSVRGSASGKSQSHFYMEPQAAYAVPEEDGMMRVGSAMQWPGGVQQKVAGCLGVPMHKVNVSMRRAGGGFGGKLTRHLHVACSAAVAAQKTNRPVRFALNRNDDVRMTGGRHELEFEYEAGFNADGKVVALKIEAFLNGGCSPDLSDFCVMSMAKNVDQTYYIPHLEIVIKACKTSLPTRTAVRGPGEIQASFAIETVLSDVALELAAKGCSEGAGGVGACGHLVRTVNMYPEGEPEKLVTHEDVKLEHYTMPRIWRELSEKVGLADKLARAEAFNADCRWRKRGVAMTPVKYWVGKDFMSGTIVVYADATILVYHGAVECGQGAHTKVIQACAMALGKVVGDGSAALPLELIRAGDTNTGVVPNMSMTGGSTTSEAACAAIMNAADQLVARLGPVKAALDAERAAAGGDDKDKQATWAEIIGKSQGGDWKINLTSNAVWRRACANGETEAEKEKHGYHNYGAAVSEVEIDVLTGESTILSSDILYDCGRSLNPAIDIGQVEGGFVMGLGYYLREDHVVDEDTGRMRSDGTWEYKPPCSQDIPVEFNVSFLKDSPYPKGVLSSKASGEPPLVLSTSVLVALKHAVAAARADVPTLAAGHFQLNAPATVEVIQGACCGAEVTHDRLAQVAAPGGGGGSGVGGDKPLSKEEQEAVDSATNC